MPVKVCFVMPVAHRIGGAEKMLWLFLRHVDPLRIEPSVIFLKDGPFVDECIGIGVDATVIPAGRVREIGHGIRTIRALARHLSRHRPDLVVEWFGTTHPWVAPAAALARVGSQIVWWQHSVEDDHDLLSRIIGLLPARAVGASSAAAADAQASMWPHRQTFVVHPGIDYLPASQDERGRVRAELGVGDQDVLVGMICRVQRWKGQHQFLQALASLRDRGVSFRGLMVGGDAYGLDPGYNREIHALHARLGLREWVTWIDQVPDPTSYVRALDVFVNASVREGGVSLAILEAMAAGRCIVAVADGGSPEAIRDERTGILIDKSDSALLADALARTLTDAGLRTRLGMAARAEYERRFTATHFARALEDRLCVLSQPHHARELALVARQPR